MNRRSSRRDFLKHTTLAGVGWWVAGGLARAESKSPNEQVNFACIGVGGKGGGDTSQAAHCGNIVALCDIDDNHLKHKAHELERKFPHLKTYNDFRKMLDEIGKQIDAVTVSTADHTHAAASIMAMRMGKHVYCQKPLTHTVQEARLMLETARQYKVATQMGNQGSAASGLRRGVEIVQAGVIGAVREVHVWTNRPIWGQAPWIVTRPKEAPVPQHVHWDLFLGPAGERPYALQPRNAEGGQPPAYHPFSWRGWWDFGTGALGDMACHTANLPFRALKLGYPASVSAECGELNPETFPAWARITYEFPEREGLPPVKLIWYEGQWIGKRVLPPKDLFKGKKVADSGSLMVGEKGILYSPDDYGAAHLLLPEEQFKDYKGPNETLPRKPRERDGDLYMKEEWVAAIRGGPPAYANFDYAAVLTEAILLGNVAMRVGKKLEWDAANMRASNCPEADQFIKPERRKGWEL